MPPEGTLSEEFYSERNLGINQGTFIQNAPTPSRFALKTETPFSFILGPGGGRMLKQLITSHFTYFNTTDIDFQTAKEYVHIIQ